MSTIDLDLATDAGVRLSLAGVLDESTDFDRLAAMCRGDVVLDLDGVTRVSSFGVGRWCATLSLSSRGPTPAGGAHPLWFVRARPCLVTQFNIIREFDCGGSLVSFYLPYLCPSCGAERLVLHDRRVRPGPVGPSLAETIPCEVCGRDAEFDDVPEVFLSYVDRVLAPIVPPHVIDLLGRGAA